MQYRQGRKVFQEYLGKEEPIEFEKAIERSKRLENELKQVREALKLLRQKVTPDSLEPIKEILQILSDQGLWEQGVELIGSWCFKIYQEYLGVESFPLRTEDIASYMLIV